MSTWCERYLNQAEFIANNYSKDISTKVGCVIVSIDNSVLTQGFNGFSRGVTDSIERLSDRKIKYSLVNHAEVNAIFNAAREGIALKNSTLYLFGLPPCNNCANAIVQSGIKNVVIRLKPHTDMSRWEESWAIAKVIFEEADIDWRIE